MVDKRHSQRKLEHLRIGLEEDVQFKGMTGGFQEYRFIHQALPELDKDKIDLSTALLGKPLQAPLIISSMTGGAESTEVINRNLAQAAQAMGVAMGVGSQRAAIEDASLAHTYRVRDVAPHILLFANLGAVQLNYGYGFEECQQAVEMIEADALILHLNPLQECLQQRGNTDFSGLLSKIELICRKLPVPVIAKEVGWGISEQAARQLAEAGVAAIDVAGSGGTSWSEVEKYRAVTERHRQIAAHFGDWGIPTTESIGMVQRGAPGMTVIASGGIRTGIDVAKAIALGADAVAMARPFLQPATVSPEAVIETIDIVLEELRIAMFCIGVADLSDLRDTPLLQRVGYGEQPRR
ncbi:MAG: type 2 isopentenyl-diphosphate Delta-isomerase [Anaerolineae bacterium]